MAQAILASFPVDRHFVPSIFESLIDKKVMGVALNFFQRLVDRLLTWAYRPYDALYLAKMARVHLFNDGLARLYDATRGRVGGVNNDSVTIGGKIVQFTNRNISALFSRHAHTDYVVVRDDASRGGGWFQISTQEIPHDGNSNPMEISWIVQDAVSASSLAAEPQTG